MCLCVCDAYADVTWYLIFSLYFAPNQIAGIFYGFVAFPKQ